jgi:hypothetical protein
MTAHAVVNVPAIREMVDHEEVGSHMVPGQLLARYMLADMYHTVLKVGVSVVFVGSHEGNVVAEPTH